MVPEIQKYSAEATNYQTAKEKIVDFTKFRNEITLPHVIEPHISKASVLRSRSFKEPHRFGGAARSRNAMRRRDILRY
jgi:hypothetical protein